MRTIFSLFCLFLFLVSCDKENNEGPSGIYRESVFITNEGPFSGGTGTVLAYNRQTGEVGNDLFEAANGRPLGNIVQSITVSESLAFIAVNNSNKVEVVSMEDFQSIATIEDISLPRYILVEGEKAYISSWDNTIKVVGLEDYTVIESLPAATGPDEMVISGEYLFAVNGGGYGTDSVVSFVNINHKEIFGMIPTGHRPTGIVKDLHGRLWVLSSGRGWNGFPDPSDTPGNLVCIDPVTREIIAQYPFQATDQHPDQLVVSDDGSTLYYAYPDGIYRFSVDDPVLQPSPFIPSSTMYYALGYDPVSDMIYASDPLDYAQNGRIYRFHATDGTSAGSFGAGIVPGGFWFNQ
jgi:hypothetical protein